uniref:MYND-type domain-containing protein n=1 Tax=Amphora coffeiformis TaxID=265554 RepID=A0A7S3L3R3_9STRA|eukprot:scaffold4534_cov85-Amphora_coffeaeformis.AAC.1
MTEPWTEPYQHMIVGQEAMIYLGPMLVGSTVYHRKLSMRALSVTLEMLHREESVPFEQKVELGDGKTESLLALSIQLTIQSYELATTKYDEPQLAILALHCLCTICKRFPPAIESLVRLGNSDELTASRVLLHGCALGINLEGDFGMLMKYFLSDFRLLVKRRHNDIAQMLLRIGTTPPTPIFMNTDVFLAFEFLHLLAEFLLSEQSYVHLTNLPLNFHTIWQNYQSDPSTYEQSAKPIKLCIAKAHEAIGNLSLAKELYASCGVEHQGNLDACLSGNATYVSVKGNFPLMHVDTFSSRELPDRKIALFVRLQSESQVEIKFYTIDPKLGDFQPCQLPPESSSWRATRIIPDHPSRTLRILVAPRELGTGEDGIDDLLPEMMSSLWLKDAPEISQLERVQVWEYKKTGQWVEVKTGGCIPDRHVVSRLGSSCDVIGNKLVVFGGTAVDLMGRSSTSDETSAGAFVLDFVAKEWFRVPHPYRQNVIGNSNPDLMDTTLPLFIATQTINVEGNHLVAMLRKGTPQVNARRQNEITDKYALDLLKLSDGNFSRIDCAWALDVATVDRCGYVALSGIGTACIHFDSMVFVMGSYLEEIVRKLKQKVHPRSTGSHVDTHALDLKKMEWRKVNLYGMEYLNCGNHARYHLVASANTDLCHVLCHSDKGISLYRLSNLRSMRQCFAPPITERKMFSKKYTLSYRLKKAFKDKTRVLRECAQCGVFESGNSVFSCCARCRVTFYCSKDCQRLHWKKSGHKEKCVPAPSNDNSAR